MPLTAATPSTTHQAHGRATTGIQTMTDYTYRGKIYDVTGPLPFGDTPSEIMQAASDCTVRVCCGSRAHKYHWRTLRNGPTKHRVLCALIRDRINTPWPTACP